MILGMNHFTIAAESRDATIDFYCGLLGLEEGIVRTWAFPARGCTRPAASKRCCTSTGIARCPPRAPA